MQNMPRITRPLLFFLQFAVAGLAAAFLIGLLWPGLGGRLRERLGMSAPAPHVQQQTPASSQASPGEGPVSYADAVERAAPGWSTSMPTRSSPNVRCRCSPI